MPDTLRLAVRDAWRSLAAAPAVSIVSILTLALGLAGTTALFTLVHGVLLKPLPFSDPARLAVVWETRRDQGVLQNVVSPANYLEWRDANRVFSGLAAVSLTFKATLTGGGGPPQEVPLQLVTRDLLTVLGVQPSIGRNFLPGEDRQGSDAILISHRLWQRRFSADRSIAGRTITMDGRPVRVVGVLPSGVTLLDDTPDVWGPLGLGEEQRTPRGRWLQVVGRLRPGVTREQAQANMDAVAASLERKWPAFDTHWGANVVMLEEQVVGGARRPLLLVGIAALFLLAIACANVAGLWLARASARAREMATRVALGATRGRLVRQGLAEAAIVGAGAGVLGVVLAVGLLRAFRLLAGDTQAIPRLEWVAMDGAVFAAALALVALTALAAGLAPAFAASRGDVAGALSSGTRSHTAPASRLRRGLVASEVGLAIVLLVGAGLLTRSVDRLFSVHPGFDRAHVLTFRVGLPEWRHDAPAKLSAALEKVIADFQTVPGVERVGACNFLPMTGLGAGTAYTVIGRPAPPLGLEPSADIRVVAGHYFEALGVPLVAGRLFSRADRPAAHAIVVNERLAREAWPGESPLGRTLRIAWRDDEPSVVIGVVGDVRADTPDVLPRPTIYFPHAFDPWPGMTVAVRSTADPLTLAAVMEQRLAALEPDATFAAARTMDDVVARSIALRRVTMRLASAFAAAAVALAGLGLFALLAFTVAVRRREIGIRAALGARGRDLTAWVVGQSARAALPGAVAGLAAAWVAAAYLRDLLYGVEAHDLATFAAVAGLVGVVVLIAAAIPARAATRVETAELLRSE